MTRWRWLLICVAVLLTVFSLAYWLVGWGLGSSPEQSQYRLVGYWTEAGGVGLDQPYAVAVAPRTGYVVVTDAANKRVVVFDGEGRTVLSFGEAGEGPGQFDLPTGVAVGLSGAIYVADFNQDRIQKFTASGEYLSEWGRFGTGDAEFNSPNGLAADGHGGVYVADFYNKVIKVFDKEGRYLRRLGRPGHWQAGALDYPTDVDVLPDGRALVADAYNYRVQLFAADGSPSSAWGWHVLWSWPFPAGDTKGFGEATGVAFGANPGRVHVADARNYRIAMLDERGRFVTDYVLSHRRGGPYAPMQVAVSNDGRRVYATDLANDRVVVLSVTKSGTDG